jgi:hypothetical protein
MGVRAAVKILSFSSENRVPLLLELPLGIGPEMDPAFGEVRCDDEGPHRHFAFGGTHAN